MKYSKFFGKTSKTVSSEIKFKSHKLLVQAGFIAESTAGRYYMLPLGMLVQNKLVDVVRRHMNKSQAQEMLTPVCHPLELWQETNRDSASGFELTLVEDRRGAQFALGGTAEEMFVDVVRRYNLSYKDLPFNIYQFGYKFRDEKRARAGLLRLREFSMKDAYAFTQNEEQFGEIYQDMTQTYLDIYNELGLEAKVVASDNGFIGGDYCHEFIVDSDIGESRYLQAEGSDYVAHEDIAVFVKQDINSQEAEEQLTEVDADRSKTVQAGAELHGLPLERQIKNVAFSSKSKGYVLAVIRADLDVNVRKLENLLGVIEDDLEPMEASDVIDVLGSYPGFISPVGIKENLKTDKQLIVVGDDSLRTIKNAYTGANVKKRDMLNVNIDRDYTCDLEGDISLAQAGYLHESGGKLVENLGIEVGNIFQNGYHYTAKMAGANFVDANNQEQNLYMGCFGIGISRTLQTIAEIHSDDKGLVWPKCVTPYHIHLIGIKAPEYAQDLYDRLQSEGLDVLFDDRDDRPGSMFADADLIGIPVRVVASGRLQEESKYEFKIRMESEAEILSLDQLITKINSYYNA